MDRRQPGATGADLIEITILVGGAVRTTMWAYGRARVLQIAGRAQREGTLEELDAARGRVKLLARDADAADRLARELGEGDAAVEPPRKKKRNK